MYRGYWYSGLNVSTVYMYQLYCKGTPPVECDTRTLTNNRKLGLMSSIETQTIQDILEASRIMRYYGKRNPLHDHTRDIGYTS